MKRPYLSLATLVIFSQYTVGTMFFADQSLIDFGLELISSPDTAQVVIDLYLLGVLAYIWMYRDARSKGRSATPLLMSFNATGLSEAYAQQRRYHAALAFADVGHRVAHEMHPAALPSHLEDLGDRRLDAFMTVRYPQLYSRKPRRIRLRRKSAQSSSASGGPTHIPRTSCPPLVLTATAIITSTEMIRPASRTLT